MDGAAVAESSQMSRWLIIGAGILLIATAGFHAAGYPSVSNTILASGLNPSLVEPLRALWLMFSMHLVMLAIVVILARSVSGARRIVLACALIIAADTALFLRFVGLFVGTFGLAAATVLLVLGGLLWTRQESSREGA
jgi:hypothetical protein